MDFAGFIREARLRKGQSRPQAAAEIGVHKNTVANWENGCFPKSLDLLRAAVQWTGDRPGFDALLYGRAS